LNNKQTNKAKQCEAREEAIESAAIQFAMEFHHHDESREMLIKGKLNIIGELLTQ